MEGFDLNSISEFSKLLDVSKILSLFFGIAFLLIIARTIRTIGEKIGSRFPSRRLLVLQIITVLNFIIYLGGGFFLVYGIIRPPKELMLAIGGSAAVAIGLSLKDLVASLVAGLILLFDRPFQVGDRVSFGDTYGEIKSIGLRAVRLTTLDDNLVTIPNSKFMTDAVASGNAGALDMMVCVDFYVSPENDIAALKKMIFEILVTSRYTFLKKPINVVVSEKIEGEMLVVVLKAKAYVLDVKYEKAFQTDIVLRVEKLFRESEIKRPYKD